MLVLVLFWFCLYVCSCTALVLQNRAPKRAKTNTNQHNKLLFFSSLFFFSFFFCFIWFHFLLFDLFFKSCQTLLKKTRNCTHWLICLFFFLSIFSFLFILFLSTFGIIFFLSFFWFFVFEVKQQVSKHFERFPSF